MLHMPRLREYETQFNPALYNELCSVEVAAHALRKRAEAFVALLEEARTLAHVHDVRVPLDALLLHKHWSVQPRELMVEVFAIKTGKPSLITRARPRAEWTRVSSACRWIVEKERQGASLVPLEYSADLGVRFAHADRDVPRGFIEDYGAVLIRSGWARTIGLTLIRRDSLMRTGDEEFVEESHDNESVITAQVVLSADRSKLIDTAWPLVDPVKLGCRPACRYTCNLQCKSACVIQCRWDGTNHRRPHGGGHMQGHGSSHRSTHVFAPVCQPHGCT